MADSPSFATPVDAAYDARILLFGRLMAAANGLEYLLARDLEESTGLTHPIFELLLIVARAGEDGVSVKDIAQAKVVTSGGATRLVSRGVAQGLVTLHPSEADGRVKLVRLSERGAAAVREAAAMHARNIERYLIAALPSGSAESFAASVRTLSKSASAALPAMP